MRIESVSATADRAGRYRIQFENGSVMRLYRQTVEDFGLYAGLELTDEETVRLRHAAGEMSAKMRAVRIVSASSVSKQDLEQRLIRKGEDPKQAREAVEWMADLDLLDDQKTAEQVVYGCIRKGYGIARARQSLYEKRIPRQFWDDALADYPDQTEKIVEFLRTRLPDDPDDRDIRRAIEALLRRGHRYADIRYAMIQLEVDTDEFPED